MTSFLLPVMALPTSLSLFPLPYDLPVSMKLIPLSIAYLISDSSLVLGAPYPTGLTYNPV